MSKILKTGENSHYTSYLMIVNQLLNNEVNNSNLKEETTSNEDLSADKLQLFKTIDGFLYPNSDKKTFITNASKDNTGKCEDGFIMEFANNGHVEVSRGGLITINEPFKLVENASNANATTDEISFQNISEIETIAVDLKAEDLINHITNKTLDIVREQLSEETFVKMLDEKIDTKIINFNQKVAAHRELSIA